MKCGSVCRFAKLHCLEARPGFEVAAPPIGRVLASHRTAPGLPISGPVRTILKGGEVGPRPYSFRLCSRPAPFRRATAGVEMIGHARSSSFSAQRMHIRDARLISKRRCNHCSKAQSEQNFNSHNPSPHALNGSGERHTT
jgi:hypothetical protein